MPTVADVIKARWSVPWQKIVALDVAVVSEQVAKSIEVEIIGIAKPMRDRFDLSALGRESDQSACLDIPYRRRRSADKLRPEACIIPADHVNPAIRPFANGVAAMFPCAKPKKPFRRSVCNPILVGI